MCHSKMNYLVKQVFKVQLNNVPIKSQHGDHVHLDYQSLIFFLINSFGMKEKAVQDSVELVFTADGAQICGAKSASQTAAGIKSMDELALDPVTKELMFVEEFDNNNQPKKLRNYQTFKNHALAERILHSETKVLVNEVLREFFIFGMKFGDVGLEAGGDEPPLRGNMSYDSTDMSFNHKCVARGGACKNKKIFCY